MTNDAINKLKCWWKHKFEMVGHIEHIAKYCGYWKRRCKRCGLTQEISSTYGYHCADKEYYS